jgi:hypothetical protein
MTHKNSLTSFDQLATETILDIFEYLSPNDIIYAFFDFNQRLNSIIFEYQYLFKNFETPTTNLNFWQNILPIIGSNIEQLIITTIDFSSLNLFSNLKSLIIHSPFEIDPDQLNSIFQSKQFEKLNSLKIKSEIYYKNYNLNSTKKIFQYKYYSADSLETPECWSTLLTSDIQVIKYLTINKNIHSLSLNLFDFDNLISLLRHTPNLKDLNVIGNSFCRRRTLTTTRNWPEIKLKKFYFTATIDDHVTWTYEHYFLPLTDLIKQFSSSLICLSIDLSQNWILENGDNKFDGITLKKQLLESMIELKTFHLYVKLKRASNSLIKYQLPTFDNEFWLEHNWSFGTHENYLYTLPFHFNKIYDFIDFDHIESNYSKILHSPFTWYHVKSIDLSKCPNLNSNLIKQIKIKMPNLISITLNSERINDLYTNEYETTLDSITTVHCEGEFIENIKQWLIYVLPNVKHLVLSYSPQPTTQLSKKMKFLQKLHTYFRDDRITTDYLYFSKIQDVEIKLLLKDVDDLYNYVLRLVKEILEMFKNLKFFIFNFYRINYSFNEPFIELNKMITLLNMDKISKNYQIKHIYHHLQFVKKEQ